jgi:glycosyltransferase involved in cell wall biosynthesis
MFTGSHPKISILVLTYNHERYIEQALRSVLRQETCFSYEIVVAEDCSTDSTLGIVKQVAAENSGLFRILHRPKNLGISRNFADAYAQCRGEFVAILEGDDFWHHNHKLQRHADTLERHKKCSFVFNDVCVLDEYGGLKEGLYPSYIKSKLRLHDFLADNFINCSSLTFRHRLISTFPKWFLSLRFYDWPLHVLHLLHGYAIYLREPMSTYRIHNSSAWHGCDEQDRLSGMIEIFNCLDNHLGYRYESIFRLNKKYRSALNELHRLRAENAKLKGELDCDLRTHGDLRNSKAYRLALLLSRVRKGLFSVKSSSAA